MKKSTKDILSNVSSNVYNNSVKYRFDKHKVYSEKYKKGNIAVYDWVSELCFYYLQKEKNLLNEFEMILKQKKDELSNLDDNEFRDGIIDALKDVEDILDRKLKS